MAIPFIEPIIENVVALAKKGDKRVLLGGAAVVGGGVGLFIYLRNRASGTAGSGLLPSNPITGGSTSGGGGSGSTDLGGLAPLTPIDTSGGNSGSIGGLPTIPALQTPIGDLYPTTPQRTSTPVTPVGDQYSSTPLTPIGDQYSNTPLPTVPSLAGNLANLPAVSPYATDYGASAVGTLPGLTGLAGVGVQPNQMSLLAGQVGQQVIHVSPLLPAGYVEGGGASLVGRPAVGATASGVVSGAGAFQSGAVGEQQAVQQASQANQQSYLALARQQVAAQQAAAQKTSSLQAEAASNAQNQYYAQARAQAATAQAQRMQVASDAQNQYYAQARAQQAQTQAQWNAYGLAQQGQQRQQQLIYQQQAQRNYQYAEQTRYNVGQQVFQVAPNIGQGYVTNPWENVGRSATPTQGGVVSGSGYFQSGAPVEQYHPIWPTIHYNGAGA